MKNKPTNELNEILENTHPEGIGAYLKEQKPYLSDEKKGFYYYVKDVLYEKNIKLKDVYIGAGVSESYGSKIITMERHTKNRDLILRLLLAGHFNWDEMNRALKLYGFSELYAKDARDACIIVAVNNRIFDTGKIDELLTAQGFDPISGDISE